ncbi:hypothetical protein SASPL_149790 [Salvia splendens]|uniref:Aquaporin SIP n=1 Tax=Salvia splendens TaxID=180675 RepID=A0A8X8W521_SALSN|nr:hypothetical protein SASPL_149790 [Salvia splendens]
MVAAVIKAAVGDAALTFLWVFCASSLGALTYVVSSALGVAPGLPSLFITTFLIFILLFIFGFLGDLLGGASFNPTGTAAFYAAGLGGADSLISASVRFPAQAAGAVGGAVAIIQAMPVQYKHMLGGPSLKVDTNTGAIAEGVLTFLMTLAVLFIIIKGPKSMFVKNGMLAISTVSLVVAVHFLVKINIEFVVATRKLWFQSVLSNVHLGRGSALPQSSWSERRSRGAAG